MANDVHLLGSVGLPALCNHIKALKSVVLQLGNAFQGTVAEIEEAINDFPIASSISVSAEGWQAVTPVDSVGDYKYYYDIVQSDIDSNDLPVVTVAPASIPTALKCWLCSTCESFNGYIRLYAKEIPEDDIIVQCWILKGRASTNDDEYFNEG